jgi:ComF family protein
MKPWMNRFLFTLFPGKCIICKASTNRHLDLCAGCQRGLPYPKSPCWQCGLEMTISNDICRACIATPPLFSHCFSLLRYEPPVDVLISRFKTGHKLAVGRVLSILLARAYQRHHIIAPHCWIPVPLHRRTLRSRGFNQALEIAQVLTEFTHIPTRGKAVRRVIDTRAQKRLDAATRRSNIRNAFELNLDLSGQSVAIVDDVVTTAATVSELAHTLLERGASDVQVVCLARTPANASRL